jgi:hypothetical protein
MALEPGVTESSWSLITIAPDGLLAIAIRETSEHDVVLLELKDSSQMGLLYWYIHRAQLDALIGVLSGWRKLYGSGPGQAVSRRTEVADDVT